MDLPPGLAQLLGAARRDSRKIVVLTGAGISAESGILTFRGPEGYWQVGSRNYRPEQLATFEAFTSMPAAIWSWYLYRRSVCRAAAPNPGHAAIAALEVALGDRMVLITQNVDGLHRRAGSSLERTYQIHGNLDFVRCARECGGVEPFPDGLARSWERGRQLDQDEAETLRCRACGSWLRPHVLWFDECYDEPRYRIDSSLAAADAASLLLVVGTSGATNLPMQICSRVHGRAGRMVVVNRNPSPFSQMAQSIASGHFLEGRAGDWVPAIVEQLTGPK